MFIKASPHVMMHRSSGSGNRDMHRSGAFAGRRRLATGPSSDSKYEEAGFASGTNATGSKPKAGITASSIENIAEATPAGAARTHDRRVAADDLLGESDLLLRRSDRYVAAYIKSGYDEEGGEDDGRQ
ncbi:hypothetical protein [Acidiphilium acidophilum]|uniref:Uncharacterized protein n=1 Tax=Acidiphilium acidophilum TaxID=76588 RepID=A0AAW9DLQ8_ACIAO|nr:hypothetical protein [Acidiphilium acidophilum]MDX5929317.1 hypothetical protein [Acidiphilium acidophilum]